MLVVSVAVSALPAAAPSAGTGSPWSRWAAPGTQQNSWRQLSPLELETAHTHPSKSGTKELHTPPLTWVLCAGNSVFSLWCPVLQFSSGSGRSLFLGLQGRWGGSLGGILQWAAALTTEEEQMVPVELPHLTTRKGWAGTRGIARKYRVHPTIIPDN